MTTVNDDQGNDAAGNLLREMVARGMDNLWNDGSSVYEVARTAVQKTFWGVAYSVGGAVAGGMLGFTFSGDKPRDEEDEELNKRDDLLHTVRVSQVVRQFAPAIEQWFSNREYDARKTLEEMGYYPCEACGVPHKVDEDHQMPPGTYWDEKLHKFVRPDDPNWNQVAYEAAAPGDKWDLETVDDDEDDGQIH